MTVAEAILLGIVQGIFMFFPVSSTSHLVLVQHWLISRGSALPNPDGAEMILFDLMVHVGTLVSIAVVFRRSLTRYLASLIGEIRGVVQGLRPLVDALCIRLAGLGLLTVFVTGVIGLSFKSTFETVFGHPLAISGMLAITGAILYWTDHLGTRQRGLRQMTLWVAIVIGLAQAFALAPGLSRSGLTIAAALLMGVRRRWAAQYSFFVAIPTILAATAVQSLKVFRSDVPLQLDWLPLALGFVVAAVVGIFALQLVLTLLYRARFRYFSWYVWLLAAVIAFSSWQGWLTPDHFHDTRPPAPVMERSTG